MSDLIPVDFDLSAALVYHEGLRYSTERLRQVKRATYNSLKELDLPIPPDLKREVEDDMENDR